MSFKIVQFLRNSQSFDLKELVHYAIDSAIKLNSESEQEEELTEVILFVLDSLRANPECVSPSDLLQLVDSVCEASLHQQSHIRGHGQQRSGSDHLKQSVYKLYAALLMTPEGLSEELTDLKARIGRECLEGLRYYVEEQRLQVNLTASDHDLEKTVHPVVLSVKDLLGVLDNAFSSCDRDTLSSFVSDSWLDDCFGTFLDVLEFSEPATCSHVSGILLPELLRISGKVAEWLSVIWRRLLDIHQSSSNRSSRQMSNVYIALCGLSGFFIPLRTSSSLEESIHQVHGSFHLLADHSFWRVIQTGLIHNDPLARKQTFFLMKRSIETISANDLTLPLTTSSSVDAATQKQSSDSAKDKYEDHLEESRMTENVSLFCWSPETQDKLLAMWADFFLLYETLDEVQIHVVRPVMPRLTSLIQAASVRQPGCLPLLHPSWLTVLFSRALVHQTKTVTQWGILQYLRLDVRSCSILQEDGKEFLFGHVLPILNDDSLYAVQAGACVTAPPIAQAFRQFMRNYLEILEAQEAKVFLCEFISAVSQQSWSPVSVIVVFDVLVNLPECSAWGATELKLLREMQFACVSGLSPSYRSIAQCLMLQTVLRLLDQDGTSLQQISSLLGLFSSCLHRNSPLWKQVCEWFEINKHSQLFGSSGDMGASLRSEVATMLTHDPVVSSSATISLGDSSESDRTACMVIIGADIHYANKSSLNPSGCLSDDKSFLGDILSPMVAVLASIGSHIYLPIIKADTSLQLLCGILGYLNQPCPDEQTAGDHTDEVKQEMTVILSSCFEEILSFIARRLLSTELFQARDTSRVSLYVTALDSVFAFLERSPRNQSNMMSSLLASGKDRMLECCKLLVTQSMETKSTDSALSQFQTLLASRLLLWFLQSSSPSDSLKLPWDTLLPLVTVNEDLEISQTKTGANSNSNKREISKSLLCTKWQCLSKLLQDSSLADTLPFLGSQPHDTILAACVRDLALVKSVDAVPIMQCAKALVGKVSHQDSVALCLDLVEATWSAVQDEWRGKAQKFWDLYTAAVQLIFQPCFMEAEVGSQLHSAVDKVIDNILAVGEAKPNLVTVLVKHLTAEWGRRLLNGEDMKPALRAISNHLSLLVHMSIMGSKVGKHTKLQQDVCVYLVELPYLQAVKGDILACIEQRPGQRRVILINFLLLMATGDSSECRQTVTVFVQELLVKYIEMKTSSSQKYGMNSQLHRQSIRLWQMVLVLVPYLRKDCAGQILQDVLGLAIREKQSSVWYLMTWVAVQLVLLVPSIEDGIWEHVMKPRDTPDVNTSPLLILIAHLGMVQADTASKERFYRRAFPALLPWALVNASSIRHLGLLCVKKTWQDCNQAGLGGILESFPALRACIYFLEEGFPADRVQNKVDSHFILFKVHPVQDFTIQTIFHILPSLTYVAEAEILEPQLFENDCPSLWRSKPNERNPMIGLYNQDGSQLQEQYRISLAGQQESMQANQGEGQAKPASADSSDNNTNVQKKVIPWQDTVMPGFDDIIMRTGEQDQQPRSKGGSLVLVASLIDKAPNLGGLCRTSQIFGVSTLVVNSLRITGDKMFQSLSVTAEKWLPIIEVPVSDLLSYLLAMRRKGYTLIGVEQTARSHCLTEYQFPERSLLLLGHERTGIPVEMIQLLDVCVEIPQQGVIRSLNVHVSGALLVWEYTRQRLLREVTKE